MNEKLKKVIKKVHELKDKEEQLYTDSVKIDHLHDAIRHAAKKHAYVVLLEEIEKIIL